MKKAFKLVIASAVAVCLAGSLCFAACGNSDEPEPTPTPSTETTYTFEAEKAALWADESELLNTLSTTTYGEYVTDCVFNVQYNDDYSGGASVGYLAENNPTVTFTINSDTAVSGATISIKAASMDLNIPDTYSSLGIFGLAWATINEFAGASHNILKLNGNAVTLSGTLPGADSVFKGDDSYDSNSNIATLLSNLNFDNWGTLTATVDLVAGTNTFVFTMEKSAGLNFDYMQITTTAALTWTETSNAGFTNNPNATDEIPPEENDDTVSKNNENEATIVENSADDYTCSVTLEAEEAGLFNAVGSTNKSTAALKVETATSRTGTDDDGNTLSFDDGQSVGNFNAEGDAVVFCVYASDDIEEVLVTITAGSATIGSGLKLADYVGSEHSGVLTVNDESAGLYGTVKASTSTLGYSSSWGYLKAGISLKAGYNYIILTCDGTGVNLDCIKLSFNSEIVTEDDDDAEVTALEDTEEDESDEDTGEETEVVYATTVESVSIASNATTITTIVESEESTEGSATLEAESASLINAIGNTNTSIVALKVETQGSRTGTGDNDEALTFESGSSVGNFNTSGDKIVFVVYADADVEVSVKITAGSATIGSGLKLADYVGSEHDILSVNGTSSALSGTVKASSSTLGYSSSWGYLTASISLVTGYNYIVLTCDGTGVNLDCLALAWTCTVQESTEATT